MKQMSKVQEKNVNQMKTKKQKNGGQEIKS